MELAAALQGHTALRSLSLMGKMDSGKDWPWQLLRWLPALQELDLLGAGRDVEAMLVDVSGCSRLTRLSADVKERHWESGTPVGPAALQALAAGPAAASLVEVSLVLGALLPVQEAAALLVRGTPALRKALLTAVLPAGSVLREVWAVLAAVAGEADEGRGRVWSVGPALPDGMSDKRSTLPVVVEVALEAAY